MARAPADDERRLAAKALATAPPGEATSRAIRAALGDRAGIVVAAAIASAAAHGLVCMAELLAAVDRLAEDGLKRDKRCLGVTACLTALDAASHDDDGLFLRFSTYTQHEPVWGGSEDTAGPVRIVCAQALFRLNHRELGRLLCDLLADPLPTVRSAAAQLLGQDGSPASRLLLRLKLRLGDSHEDVTADVLTALMAADPRATLDLAVQRLDDESPVIADAAAVALGQSRLDAALEPLRLAFRSCDDPPRLPVYATAIAVLRSEAAIDTLIAIARERDRARAKAAIAALDLHRDRPAVAAALAGLAGRT
jgi:hypothetical protein